MPTKWHGDASDQLPAQQVEPYRLWFEFLKLASNDPTIKVDHAVYKSWGAYEQFDFDKWWSQHWRLLFSISVGVRVITTSEAMQQGKEHLILSIPLHQDKRVSLSQVRRLLDEKDAGSQLRKMPKGQFFFNVGGGDDGHIIDPSVRFLRNLPKVRLLMHLYRFWLRHPDLDDKKRLEAMSKDYFAWADAWNRKIRERKWKRDLIEIPTALSEYVRYLEKRGNRQRVSLFKLNEADIPNSRRQVARYLLKARRIADNVVKGIFPGAYDKAPLAKSKRVSKRK
jgi:hypothetical protein